tara:strand:+ start:1441 stop:1746 length:306 start_codon:yes stop_codon:yes gene_type:complete
MMTEFTTRPQLFLKMDRPLQLEELVQIVREVEEIERNPPLFIGGGKYPDKFLRVYVDDKPGREGFSYHVEVVGCISGGKTTVSLARKDYTGLVERAESAKT